MQRHEHDQVVDAVVGEVDEVVANGDERETAMLVAPPIPHIGDRDIVTEGCDATGDLATPSAQIEHRSGNEVIGELRQGDFGSGCHAG